MKPSYSVILVSPFAHYPGHSWSYTEAIREALRRRGLSVRVVAFLLREPLVPVEERAGVDCVFSRPPFPWNRQKLERIQRSRAIRALQIIETFLSLRKALTLARGVGNPILHFIGGSYWVTLAVPRLKRARLVCTVFGGLPSISEHSDPAASGQKQLLTRTIRRALATDRLDFVCETELIRDEALPLAGRHIHHIPYAINDRENMPSQVEARRRLGLDANCKILLFFGTHREEKDYRTALRGCLQMPDPPFALFVGKVISQNDPQRLIAELKYPCARVVDEFVPEELANFYFAASDVVVLPYEAGFTRGSGVLIEGCRYDRPMIASATPYFSSFIRRYGCGVTYAPGDPGSFAQAARQVLSDVQAYAPALQRARQDHSWTVVSSRYLNLYDEIASRAALATLKYGSPG